MKYSLTVFLLLAVQVMAQETPTNKTPDVTYSDKVTTNNVNVTIKGKPVVFTDYASKPTNAVWRFGHNGSEIKVMPFWSASTMYTPWKVETCQTVEGISNAVIKLNLKLTEDQSNELANIIEQYGKDRDAKKTVSAVDVEAKP